MSLDMGAKTVTGVNLGHCRNVLRQTFNVNDDRWGGEVIDIHSAGEGTRTPNTQDLNLLPLPIGLHRRHLQGTGGTHGR